MCRFKSYGYLSCRYSHPEAAVRRERIEQAQRLAEWIGETYGVEILPWWEGVDPEIPDTPDRRIRGLVANYKILSQLRRMAIEGQDVVLFVDARYPTSEGMKDEIAYWAMLWEQDGTLPPIVYLRPGMEAV